MKTLDLILSIGVLFIKALVLYKLYQWFLLPLGLPNLSMGHLYGIAIFYYVLKLSDKSAREAFERDKDYAKELTITITIIVTLLIFLTIGYFLK